MGKKTCENCERVIGNLEESFLYKNHVVCKACKILLEEDSQAIEVVESNAETEIPIAETLPQVCADTEHEHTAGLIQQDKQERHYGGIGRTGYFLGMLVVAIFNAIAQTQGEPGIAYIGLIITFVACFILVVIRLQNIGKSGWWSLLLIVPFANLLVGIFCAIFPEGYQDTKKLDTAGKIITGILIVLAVVAFVTGIYLGLRDSQKQSTLQPDVEIMAEELSRALEGISKENITKELIEKFNDVPTQYTSLSDGFAVYFPSTPQQNTIENVMGETVKNYQSVSQDELVQYNVFLNYFDKKILSDESQEAYLNGHLTGRLLFSKNSKVITNNQIVFRGFNASRYKYIDVVEGVEILHEGIVFILDGDSVSLTCVYPKAVDPQPSFDEFVKSFELLPLEARLSDEFWKDLSTGLIFRPPIDMHEREKKSRKSIIVTFVNKAGHSISIINVTAEYPSFKLSDIRKEFPQARRDSEGFLLNTIHNPTLNMDFFQLVKLLEHENNIFMLQGYAPKKTFFRSERIFKESINTVTFVN